MRERGMETRLLVPLIYLNNQEENGQGSRRDSREGTAWREKSLGYAEVQICMNMETTDISPPRWIKLFFLT